MSIGPGSKNRTWLMPAVFMLACLLAKQTFKSTLELDSRLLQMGIIVNDDKIITAVAATEAPSAIETGSPVINETEAPSAIETASSVTEESEATSAIETGSLPTHRTLDNMPAWTKFRRTQFTDHILETVVKFKLKHVIRGEALKFNFTVSSPNTIPTIHSDPNYQGGHHVWFPFLKQLFLNRTLAYNVSVAFSLGDNIPADCPDQFAIFGSSAVNGTTCVPNMQEIRAAGMRITESGRDDETKFAHTFMLQERNSSFPWHDRDSIPIFRGSATADFSLSLNCETMSYPKIKKKFTKRIALVDYSVDHPLLLNARFTDVESPEFKVCFASNNTGLDKLLPLSEYIKERYYFTRYQTVVVMGGHGAAYRTNKHFWGRQAVILQDFQYEEWFTHLLEPWVNYIPLKEDLSDLGNILRWVRDHPKEVEEIGNQGRLFYDKYLTWSRIEEHMYELIYRLSEYSHYTLSQVKEQ